VIRIPQLPGAAGIVQTVALMRAYVNQDASHPLITQQAHRATAMCGRADVFCKVKAIEEWTRNLIRYEPDPEREERLATPAILAAVVDRHLRGRPYRAFGDCDEMTLYAAALAASIGLHPVFQVVGRGPRFSHVYLTVNGIPLDPTVAMGTPVYPAARRMTLAV